MSGEPPDEPQVEDDLLGEIQRIADDLEGRPDGGDLIARLDYIVNLLIMRGHLKPGHRRLLDKVRAERSPVHLSAFPDKHHVVGANIDCPSLLHLCKARCCSFQVTLSAQDVSERKLEWELLEPYKLLKNKRTGYCTYLGKTGGCGAYHDRPATCRLYDCRQDKRVWLDWDNKIPAPLDRTNIVEPLGEWVDYDESKPDDG